MQPFEYRSVRYWSKEINGTRTGGRKTKFFNSRPRAPYCLSALAARCRWAAVSCAARLTSSRGCPFRSGPAGGSPRWLFGGTEGCRCRRASELPPRTGFGAKCDYSRCRCSLAARFSLRGRVPVCSLLSTARSRARQIAVSVRSGPEVSPGSLRVEVYMASRLQRMRGRFQHISANSLNHPTHSCMNYLAMASRALGEPQAPSMRRRRLPTTRPTPRDVQEPICAWKKCVIWAR